MKEVNDNKKNDVTEESIKVYFLVSCCTKWCFSPA